MKGYKAFKKGLICDPTGKNPFQFAENTVFETDEAKNKKKDDTLIKAGGYYSTLAGGDSSTLAGGKRSILVGDNGSLARGSLGSLIVLVAREWRDGEYVITDYKAALVDGETVKADTWYKLECGEFVEVSV